MKICFIAPADTAHMAKWATWFAGRGHEVHVVSFTRGKIPGVTVHFVDTGVDPEDADFSKLKYLLYASRLKDRVEEIGPDVVHVHYATSYGTVAALSGIKPYFLSVWGTDIYDFPRRGIIHKAMLKYSLKRASRLLSTSASMAKEAQKYTKKRFEITPFGVDMELFSPDKCTRTGSVPFVVGTVKKLDSVYGIDYLLEAVSMIVREEPDFDIEVRIAGDGPKASEYKELAQTLGISDRTAFLGQIPQEEAAKEWANMDVAVIPSVSYESFGVAAVEAQACCTPVIISDVEGLLESTSPGTSSIVVPQRDARAIADAIIRLYKDPELRETMGLSGRQYVVNNYSIDECFERIESLLADFVTQSGSGL